MSGCRLRLLDDRNTSLLVDYAPLTIRNLVQEFMWNKCVVVATPSNINETEGSIRLNVDILLCYRCEIVLVIAL